MLTKYVRHHHVASVMLIVPYVGDHVEALTVAQLGGGVVVVVVVVMHQCYLSRRQYSVGRVAKRGWPLPPPEMSQ